MIFLEYLYLPLSNRYVKIDIGPHTGADIIKLLKLFLFDGPLVFQAANSDATPPTGLT
jgi:hypothetical protein